MKRNLWILAILALGTLTAQGKSPQGHEDLMSHLFPPELINAHAQEIGLAKDQEEKLIKELRAFQGENVELKWKLDSETNSLLRLLRPDHIDEKAAVGQLATLVEREASAKKSRLAFLIRVKNLLTPEQQAKLSGIRKKSQD